MSNSLYIGTAGWSYPHWKGVVFPKALPAGLHPLELLSKTFNVVEVNSSFYHAIKPEVSKLWVRKVERNERFLFTAKLHQRFTHERILEDAEVAAFKEGLWPMLKAGKLGAVLMQFPWAFRFTAENRDFLIKLRRTFHEFPLVAEMRHSSWLREEGVGTFLDYRIGFCNIDQPEYQSAMPATAYMTSNIGYVRLHGRNPRNAMGGFERNSEASTRMRQHDYLYSEAELEEWAKRLEKIRRFADATFVIFNNDAGAKSYVNALQMQSMAQGRTVAAPRELRRRFPMQLERFSPAHQEQQCLFPAA